MQVVESAADMPSESDYTYAHCSHALIAAIAQLRDPLAPYASHQPPRGPRAVPISKEDMLYWAVQYESHSYVLDWVAGIMFEMVGLSEEAQALGRYWSENVVLEVLGKVGGSTIVAIYARQDSCVYLGRL